MTRTAFLAAFRAAFVASYPWAADPARLEHFMAAARDDLAGIAPRVDWSGSAALQAWREIGGKGKPTRKALRSLPDGADA